MRWAGIVFSWSVFLILSACGGEENQNVLHFATSAEYPPFEYQDNGVIQGFDIDLARLIAQKMGKKAVFDPMQFSSILPALVSHQVDAAISTITITSDRQKQVDFSIPYYFEGMAMVFNSSMPITQPQQLAGHKIAVQLGTTMELWLKKHAPMTEVIAMNTNNQAIAALKAKHVDGVFLDGTQGLVFSQKNPGLSYAIIAQSDDGYGIAMNQDSKLTPKINQALQSLQQSGALNQLKKKWALTVIQSTSFRR